MTNYTKVDDQFVIDQARGQFWYKFPPTSYNMSAMYWHNRNHLNMSHADAYRCVKAAKEAYYSRISH